MYNIWVHYIRKEWTKWSEPVKTLTYTVCWKAGAVTQTFSLHMYFYTTVLSAPQIWYHTRSHVIRISVWLWLGYLCDIAYCSFQSWQLSEDFSMIMVMTMLMSMFGLGRIDLLRCCWIAAAVGYCCCCKLLLLLQASMVVQVMYAKFEVICSLFHKSMKLRTIVQIRALNIFINGANAKTPRG